MYKVTLYQRANYPNGGQVLLDTSSGINPGVVAAVCEPKLNEAGSFTFTIAKRHPLYDSIAALETYVSVEEDSEEIFYGRIIMIQKNRIGGTKQVTCEGAFAFLLDYEMNADAEETTYAAAAYFQRCIDAYNAGIGTDPARHIGVGTINISGASESKAYKNGSVSQVQSVLRSKLMNAYDGFIRIRRNGTDHLIDWLSQVGTDNPQTIAIAQNVISQATNESGEDIFTLIWPQGNDKIRIDPIPLSQDMLSRYGRIIRTVNFDANNEADLRTKALAYIAKLRDRLSLTGDIGFVDMQYLDGTSPRVMTGDVFTHITGYEGTRFTAESVKRDLLNPANDKVSLKTDKDLMNTANSNGANSGSSAVGGAGGGAGRSLSGGGSKWYKFIHETDEDLFLAAKNIEISAQEKIDLNARHISENAETISRVSAVADGAANKWTSFEGTGIYQNREAIDAVAGKFKIDNQGKLVLKEGTQFRISANGTSTNVGQLIFEQDNRVGDVGQLLLGYQGSYTYQHDNEIGGLVGAYETNTYRDPQNPFKEITPSAGANPKELGYYEKNGDNYVKTNDETAVAGKKYYVSNDITEVIFKGGGGYKIRKDGVEYGVYDEENLSGGVIVDKLNDGSTTTRIKGTRVIIGEDLDDDDLSTWAADADAGTGVFAKFLTVKRLTAQEISTMLADISDAALGGLSVDGQANFSQAVYIGDDDGLGYLEVVGPVAATDFQVIGEGDYHATLNVVDAELSNDGKTLYIWKVGDATANPSITFRKATLLNGTWGGGGHLLTVSTDTDADINYKIAFDAPAQTANHYMEVEVGDVTVLSPGYLSTPINVNSVAYGSGEDDDTVTTRYTKTWIENVTGLLESKSITANTTSPITPSSGKIGINSITVNVPQKVTYDSAYPDPNHEGQTIKVIKGGSSGADFLKIYTSTGNITGTGAARKRTTTVYAGSSTVETIDNTDYVSGWTDALATKVVSAETAASTDIAIKELGYDEKWKVVFKLAKASDTGTTKSDVSTYVVKSKPDRWNEGGATADLKKESIAESAIPSGDTPIELGDGVYYKVSPVYTNASGVETAVTGHIAYFKGKTIEKQVPVPSGDYKSGYVNGWNAARGKISLSGDTVKQPKTMTSYVEDAGTENFKTAKAHNGTLHKGSAWGKAKSYYRIRTPGGAGGWTGETGYQATGSYKYSSSITFEYKSDGGYWGWNTEPSVDSPSITWE